MTFKQVSGKVGKLFLLAAMAAALPGQPGDQPYYSLATSRSYGPGDSKPTVTLNGFHVDSLDFRVYRINDPVKFFQQLESPHQFGGQVQAPSRGKTFLEALRSWKHSVRTNIRRSLREQFTEPPSQHIEGLLPKSSPALQQPANAAQFAEAPLLNPQQLVATFNHPFRAGSRWVSEEVPVPVNDAGVYLVEAVHQDLRAYTIVLISDLVMISKNSRGRVMNFVVDRKSGAPVPGIEVLALVSKDKPLAAKSDKDGMAGIPVAGAVNSELTLLAHRGNNYAVNTLSYGMFEPQWTGYIYTDRPVYRPGHTVHFKSVMRLKTVDGFEVPAGKKVNVEINDADQKPIYQKSLTISQSGTIHDELTLPASASLGGYFINIKGGAADDYYSSMNGSFEVEAYKKPEYEVRVTNSKSRVLQGETVQATIEAKYFFGEPVAGAKVTYAVYRSGYWLPLWYDPEDETEQASGDGDGGDAGNDFGGDQVGEQEGKLDADGKLVIQVPTAVSPDGVDYSYRIQARVTDAANREIAGSSWLVATHGTFALHIEPERYVYEPGTKATLKASARDYDSKPISAKAHLRMFRWNRNKQETQILESDVQIGADGEGRAEISIPNDGGGYRLELTAKTPEGRTVRDTSSLWVSGSSWAKSESRRGSLQIISDKKKYAPGDTAKLLVLTGQAGCSVYVTVEGRDLRQTKLLRAKGSTVSFDVPITAANEPGLTVSAVFIRDGVSYSADKYLRVPPLEHQLNIKLATNKPQYQPGESGDYSLAVTDYQGRPVPRAEVSLGVVDEAVYGVRPDTTPNILNFFFGHDYNRVVTQNSLQYYFNGSAGKRRMQLAELRAPSHLAQLKPERLVLPKIRKEFPDTAFWAAEITTDDSGHAKAKVDFPDSLTTWRATARGITANTSVGSATLKTIVRKNLILRLVTPRFLVQGDEVTISALVHNYLQTTKTVRVSLDMEGLEVISGKTQDVVVPSRGEVSVAWRVRPAANARKAVFSGKALTNEESDALQLEIPVNFPGVKLSQSKGGALAPGTSTEFDITYPDKIEPGSRSLSLRVSPSIAGSLFGALEYLTAFPYGCVEQTMSSFLPNIIVKDAIQSLNLKTNLDEAQLKLKINAGLERLYNFQHPDGGWGWWETDASHPFMTAYVVAGLVQAKNAGVTVNSDAIERGAQWLMKEGSGNTKLSPDFRAYSLYAESLAGKGDNSLLDALYSKRSELTPYGLALLGLAYENRKSGPLAEIAALLEKAASQDGENAWWPAKRDPLLDFDTDATPEASAFVVKFLSHQKKDSPLLPKAAYWLVTHRNEGYWWSTTKQTAMVIYGLTDYVKSAQELQPSLDVTVSVNGKTVLQKKLDQAFNLNAPDLVIEDGRLNPGANRIRVSVSGTGRLYYGARAEYYSSEPRVMQNGTTSLNVLRDYFRMIPGKSGEKVVYDTAPLDGSVATGDLIAVRLVVTGSMWKYLLIEDPIPAGTEFISRDQDYELRNRPPWWNWYFDRRELHDDHMAIFQTYFNRGQREYFYLLKVVNPGVFQANPARVSPMYNNDVTATTGARKLEVK